MEDEVQLAQTIANHVAFAIERKQAERALRESVEKYRTLIESSSDCVCHIDLDGRFIYMNPGGVKLNELESFEEVCGLDCATAVKEEYKALMQDALNRAKKGETVGLEYESTTAKGRDRWWGSTISPIKDDKGRVISLLRISRDITERKKAEEKLENAYNELKTLDEMKANLIANVSHELRTPITIANSALELLGEEEVPEEKNKLLKLAREALMRQNIIVENLIEAANIEKGLEKLKVESVDVVRVVKTVGDEFRPWLIRYKIEMDYRLTEDLPLVKVNIKRFKMVLRNLINNAIKFNKEGGNITIEAKKIKGIVQICVIDTGIGISKDKIGKVFDRFYQVDASSTRAYGGTGAGLAVCRDIIELYGGKITAKSEVGKGSRFCFTLPRA